MVSDSVDPLVLGVDLAKGKQVAALNSRIAMVESDLKTISQKLDMIDGVNKWRPSVDTAVETLSHSVTILTSRVEVLENTHLQHSKVPLLEEEGRASGHRVDTSYQGSDRVLIPKQPLVKGEFSSPHITSRAYHEFGDAIGRPYNSYGGHGSGSYFRMPKTDLPMDLRGGHGSGSSIMGSLANLSLNYSRRM